jgi:hypothetical protein
MTAKFFESEFIPLKGVLIKRALQGCLSTIASSRLHFAQSAYD